jgi:hypothetical protein
MPAAHATIGRGARLTVLDQLLAKVGTTGVSALVGHSPNVCATAPGVRRSREREKPRTVGVGPAQAAIFHALWNLEMSGPQRG